MMTENLGDKKIKKGEIVKVNPQTVERYARWYGYRRYNRLTPEERVGDFVVVTRIVTGKWIGRKATITPITNLVRGELLEGRYVTQDIEKSFSINVLGLMRTNTKNKALLNKVEEE